MMLSKTIFSLSILLCTSTLLNGMNTLLNKTSTIQSNVAVLVLADLSEATTFSTVDKTLITISSTYDYINSALQTISATTFSIESFTDLADNAGVTAVSKLNVAASAYAIPQSIIGNMLSLDQTIGSQLATISSELDVSTATAGTISSKLDYIVPIVSGIDTALVNTSILNVLWSTIDVALQTINSTIQRVDTTAQHVSSFISDIGTQISTDIPIASTASSLIDVSNSLAPTIASIDVFTQSRLSNIANTLSRIDREIVSIQSSLTFAGTVATLDTVDFFGTWTALDRLNSTLLTTASAANTLSSAVSSLYFAYSNAGTFTVINAINQSLFTSESRVAVLSAALNTQAAYQGTFTALNAIVAQERTSQSLLDSTAVLQHTLLGTPIYQSTVGTTGYTITSAGSYYLAENINFAPSTTGLSAITINASNVQLNLNGKVLRQTNTTATVNGIRHPSGSINNIIIENGSIMDFSNTSILLVNVHHVIIQDITTNRGVVFTNIVDNFIIRRLNAFTIPVTSVMPVALRLTNAKNGIIEDCALAAPDLSSGVALLVGSPFQNIWIKNCSFYSRSLVSDAVSMAGSNNCYFENLVSSNNANTGFALQPPLANRWMVMKGCSFMENGGAGFLANFISESIVMNNTISGNNGFGINISNPGAIGINSAFLFNTLEQNSAGNIIEILGPNSYLGNVAFSSVSDQLNYSLNNSVITNINSLVRQSGALPANLPTYWYNLSVLP